MVVGIKIPIQFCYLFVHVFVRLLICVIKGWYLFLLFLLNLLLLQ